MVIAIGADHKGFVHKECIKQNFPDITWHDVGAYDDIRSDYPLFAQYVCEAMRDNKAQAGILICGSGVGMAIAANRYSKIYAALAWNESVAKQSKEHDGANVLVIPSDYVTCDEAILMVRAWHTATLSGERHKERLAMIDKLPI